MPVEVVFESAAVPEDYLVWKAIAEAVLGPRSARVTARMTTQGWDVTIQAVDRSGFSTLAHPHSDGDFEIELRRALRAAGIPITRI